MRRLLESVKDNILIKVDAATIDKIIFKRGINFLADKHSARDPIHVERLLKLFRSILRERYYDVLSQMDVARLVHVASDGLRCENEFLFKEYTLVLSELFKPLSLPVDLT
ncbi:hypothetical protein RF11_07503 [Thelohanellus kitauei]|uniref:Uncharacterized protein n=1 Tax=Thelohanellus kitauei TaxID=669202 RepID=A0A0C2MIX5_THEKT|nr:hypothetical protein RF11_07503 [Thelohanellus kitauei]